MRRCRYIRYWIFFGSFFNFFFSIATFAKAPTEKCDYEGQLQSHNGSLSAQSTTSFEDGHILKLRILAHLRVQSFMNSLDYQIDEVSYWKERQMISVYQHIRDIRSGRVHAQRWDAFLGEGVSASKGYHGYRIQGKTAMEFAAQFPGFATYWDANFSQDWIGGYAAGKPQRRPDLDLPESEFAPQMGTPLSFALYWVRYLPPMSRRLSLFLPGEKKQKRLNLNILSASAGGELRWQIPFYIGALHTQEDRPAHVQISSGKKLQKIDFHFVHPLASLDGVLALTGCR